MGQKDSALDKRYAETLPGLLGVEFLPAPAGEARARMRVERKLCQPGGVLSGGASLALAEMLAGHGSLLLCAEGEFPLGVQVSGNHVRAAAMGEVVTATGQLLQRGRTVHVWNIDITDEQGRLVSTSRVVNYIKRNK